MELRIYNQGQKDFVDFDLDYFIECLVKERKNAKQNAPTGVANGIISKCITKACADKTITGTLPDLFTIEISNFF